MYLGLIAEYGAVDQVFDNPLHPYTKALLKSIPQLGKTAGQRLASIKGNVPIPINMPDLCPFLSRCTEKMEVCEIEPPKYVEAEPGHFVRCLHYGGVPNE
jgi:oligopeptide/dipeptide ABC transporter ATP-binding protein